MAATLTIEISDQLFQQLERQSREQGKTAQVLAVECLARGLASPADDRLLRWVGAFESATPDAAERHDDYLGKAFHEELTGGQGR
jgi:hypothetical protein